MSGGKSVIIECAQTGRVFLIRFSDTQDLSLSLLKSQLNVYTSIPPVEQILLIGPPFRQLTDAILTPSFTLGEGERIFLYSVAMFTRPSSDMAHGGMVEIRLPPFEIRPPEPIDEVSMSLCNLLGKKASNPLYTCLSNIKRGEAYLLTTQEALKSIKRCVDEHAVQRDAFQAALSNLQEYLKNAKNNYQSIEGKVTSQQSKHAALLQGFHESIDRLAHIPLHPALIAILSHAPQSSGGSNAPTAVTAGATSSGLLSGVTGVSLGGVSNTSIENQLANSSSELTRIRTLHQCLPIEKELIWAKHCASAHEKIETNLKNLQLSFDEVAGVISRLEMPLFDSDALQAIVTKAEMDFVQQHAAVESLRADYRLIYDAVTAANPAILENDNEALALETRVSNQRANILDPMSTRCQAIIEAKNTVANSQTQLIRALFDGMRAISESQNNIKHKIKKGIDDLKQWLKGHNEYFNHLEHVTQLPNAYEGFLWEIVRRQAFHQLYQNKITAVCEEINRLRAQETAHRERFMQECGHHLPPLFFELVPSLKLKPPYFDASLTDEQWLPKVTLQEASKASQQINSLLLVEPHSPQPRTSGPEGPLTLITSSHSQSGGVDTGSTGLGTIGTVGSGGGGGLVDLTERCNLLEYENAMLLAKIAELTRQANSQPNSSPAVAAAAAAAGIHHLMYKDEATSPRTPPPIPPPPVSTPRPHQPQQSQQQDLPSNDTSTSSTEDTVHNINNNINNNTGKALSMEELVRKASLVDTLLAGMMSIQASLELDDTCQQILGNHLKQIDLQAQIGTDPKADAGTSSGIDEAIAVGGGGGGGGSSSSSGDTVDVAFKVQEIVTLVERTKRALIRKIEAVKLESQEAWEIHASRQWTSPSANTTATTTATANQSQLDPFQLNQLNQLNQQSMMITCKSFDVGQIALFLPMNPDNDMFVAFHVQCPHRYLSRESLQTFRASLAAAAVADHHSNRGGASTTSNASTSVAATTGRLDFVLGRIIFTETHIASREFNPFGLHLGTEFHLLHVEQMI